MILAKSGDKLRSLKNYLGLALSVRATISDSKSDFHKEFPYVIPPIYRKLADELLVELHLLSHQKNFKEKLLADSLLGMAIYGHFRTEHILVHHRYVGTKYDAVTARFDESFYKFFLRVLPT